MPKYYDNIIDLPLSKYIEVAVKGNIYALVIEPEPAPTVEELTKAWNIIQQEYADAIGDGEVCLYARLMRDAKDLETDYHYVELCIRTLTNFINLDHTFIQSVMPELIETYFTPFAGDINRILRQKFKFDHTNKDKCLAEFKRCTNLNKGIKLRWQVKQMELETLQKKHEGKLVKPTAEYFYSMLNVLSEDAKYEVPDSITVYRFCDKIRRYTKKMTA